MSEDQLNERIAELLGWPDALNWATDRESVHRDLLPRLEDDQWRPFVQYLRADIMKLPLSYRQRFDEASMLMQVSAYQLCRAFVKTMEAK